MPSQKNLSPNFFLYIKLLYIVSLKKKVVCFTCSVFYYLDQICALNQLLACEKPTCKAHDNCSPHRFDWMLETRPTSQGLPRDDISLACVVDVCFVPYRKNPPWTDCRKTTNLPFQVIILNSICTAKTNTIFFLHY